MAQRVSKRLVTIQVIVICKRRNGILRADSGGVRVDIRTVTSSKIAEVSAYEQVTFDRLESTPGTA